MKALYYLMVCISVVVVGSAQEFNPTSTLQSLVDTERAFAKASVDQGTRPAFLAYIAEDGILFRPMAVNGKKWMLDHPLPASEKRPLLAWQPVFADIALAGDMGYTFGPWEYKEDIKDEKAVAYGHFVTVWKKQADGSWKFVIDHGVSHAAPTTQTKPWLLPADYKPKLWEPSAFNLESERQDLFTYDRKFSKASAEQGLTKALLDRAGPEIRLFRNGHYPFVGADGIKRALAKRSPGVRVTWQPSGGDLSTSGDLGYTYGTYTVVSKSEDQTVERGNYLRIWKKQNGVWKMMVDVADPLPAEAKD